MAKNLFNSIKLMRPKNNVFDLTHDVKTTTDMGRLTPIMCLEAVPGDRFNIAAESLLRFAPMVAPVMHRMDVTMHYFFVPNRIIWQNWEKFIVNDNSKPVAPYFEYNQTLYDTNTYKLIDYMGLPRPTSALSTVRVNALPFAAYQAIYNEYYRDQNLIPEVDYKLLDGDNSASYRWITTRYRAWEHDYFTAALPFAQKGAAVDIPLGDVALKDDYPLSNAPSFRKITDGSLGASGTINNNGATPSITSSGDVLTNLAYDPAGSLETQPTTINDLRRAFKLQEWLERNARGGTRYIENILAHFGVKSSDKRLQRPEYITGTKSPVVVSEVLNTSNTAEAPQGNMSGHGYSVTSGHQGSYFCEEHGYIIGIMSIMPKTAYMQGIPKHFLKIEDAFQYYWPTFAHLGEQEVLNKEIYVDHTTPDGTFGYVPRYAEYKYMPGMVTGDFRSSLNFWHLGRIFSTSPALNQQFIEMTPVASKRIFAVVEEDVDSLYCHVLNKVRAVRPMPKFGTPMM